MVAWLRAAIRCGDVGMLRRAPGLLDERQPDVRALAPKNLFDDTMRELLRERMAAAGVRSTTTTPSMHGHDLHQASEREMFNRLVENGLLDDRMREYMRERAATAAAASSR
mmetsp:Transcript_109033/g.314058  ORF Transcript_109033/g.314058 Transcript_109033/m.314058 type:complete len:111 (-) Transcript_109033:239-571(-)